MTTPAVSIFSTFAAALLAVGLTACGKSEEKPAPPSAPASATRSGDAPKSPAGVPGTTAASTVIGRIDSLDGDVRIVGVTAERRAQTGTELREGETVRAGADAWALIEMSDGASITLRPDTELRFDRYRYAPDGEANQNSVMMSLFKGAARSITGYIGQTNRGGYQIQTPTATIGIRGTDHEPAYYPPPAPGEKSDRPPGTYDKVNAGESVIRQSTGEVSVKRGQTAFAHYDVRIRPRLLPTAPAFYRQHAQVDNKVAVRRTEFHRQFDQRQQRLQQERRQQQALQKAQERKDQKRLDQQKGKKPPDQKGRLPETKDKKEARQQDKKQQDQKGKPASDKKQAGQKGARPADQKRQPDHKAKDEKKAALPPSVAERTRTMQRGDKNITPAPQQSRPQRPQPPQQQQKQQPQQQNQRQQAQPQRDQVRKKPEPKQSQR